MKNKQTVSVLPSGRVLFYLALAVWLVCLWFFLKGLLFAVPVDVDETFRIQETQMLMKAHLSQTPVLLSPVAGYLAFLAPLVRFIPPWWLPVVGRLVGFLQLVFALAVVFYLLRRLFPEDGRNGLYFSTILFFSSVSTLFKVTELRPDSLAATFLLLGGACYFSSEGFRSRILGLVFLGVGISIRLDSVLAVIPIFFIVFVQYRRRRFYPARLLEPLIPILFYLFMNLLIYRRHFVQAISDFPMIARMYGTDGTMESISWYWSGFYPMVLAMAIGAMVLVVLILRSRKGSLLAIWVLVSSLLILGHHLTTGATYQHNFWVPIYFLIPFAGVGLARSMRIFLDGRSAGLWISALPLIAALWSLNGILLTLPRYTGSPIVPSLNCRMTEDKKVFDFSKGSLAEFSKQQIAYQEYSPVELKRFFTWIGQRYGDDLILHSNDFLFPFGVVLPPYPAGSIESIYYWNRTLDTTLKGSPTEKEFTQRFPTGRFMIDGKRHSVSDYLRLSKPDVMVLDHFLEILACLDPKLRGALKQEYQMVIADGEVPVFLLTSSDSSEGTTDD